MVGLFGFLFTACLLLAFWLFLSVRESRRLSEAEINRQQAAHARQNTETLNLVSRNLGGKVTSHSVNVSSLRWNERLMDIVRATDIEEKTRLTERIEFEVQTRRHFNQFFLTINATGLIICSG